MFKRDAATTISASLVAVIVIIAVIIGFRSFAKPSHDDIHQAHHKQKTQQVHQERETSNGPETRAVTLANSVSFHQTEKVQATPTSTSQAETLPRETIRLAVGDRLEIDFYEKLNFEGDRWDNERNPVRTLHRHSALSGDFIVQSGGTISLPMFGRVKIADSTEAAAEQELARLFEEQFGRSGSVSVVLKERLPVYVMGIVKAPGAYTLTPFMTVGHIVALAGGFEQNVDQTSRRRVAQLYARRAVLVAERDQASEISTTLTEPVIDLVGPLAAERLISNIQFNRNLAQQADAAQEVEIQAEIDAAQKQLDSLEATVALQEENVKLREQRYDALQQLADQGHMRQTMVINAQSELADAQKGLKDTKLAIADAKSKVARTQSEKAKHSLNVRLFLENEISAVDDEISTKMKANGTSQFIPMEMIDTKNQHEEALDVNSGSIYSAIEYEVVRRTVDGTTILTASETTDLEPGDLIRVFIGNDHNRKTRSLSNNQTNMEKNTDRTKTVSADILSPREPSEREADSAIELDETVPLPELKKKSPPSPTLQTKIVPPDHAQSADEVTEDAPTETVEVEIVKENEFSEAVPILGPPLKIGGPIKKTPTQKPTDELIEAIAPSHATDGFKADEKDQQTAESTPQDMTKNSGVEPDIDNGSSETAKINEKMNDKKAENSATNDLDADRNLETNLSSPTKNSQPIEQASPRVTKLSPKNFKHEPANSTTKKIELQGNIHEDHEASDQQNDSHSIIAKPTFSISIDDEIKSRTEQLRKSNDNTKFSGLIIVIPPDGAGDQNESDVQSNEVPTVEENTESTTSTENKQSKKEPPEKPTGGVKIFGSIIEEAY